MSVESERLKAELAFEKNRVAYLIDSENHLKGQIHDLLRKNAELQEELDEILEHWDGVKGGLS